MKTFELFDQLQNDGITLFKNKSEILIHSPFAVNSHVLSVTPMKVECPSLRWDSDAEYQAIKWAIDFDKWQYSWHSEIMPVNYDHFLEIIQGKVLEKSKQLVQLSSVAIFLENRINKLNSDGVLTSKSEQQIKKEIEDCEPF